MGRLQQGRVSDRKKRRMPCRLRVNQTEHNGLVIDLSPSGLFIQTTAKARPGQQIELVFADSGGAPIELRVEVARRKAVPARLLSVAHGGIGVKIVNAPENFYSFLGELGIGAGGGGPSAESASAPVPARLFRLQVSLGARTKRLDLEAADADAAERLALEQLGEGWKVLDVKSAD